MQMSMETIDCMKSKMEHHIQKQCANINNQEELKEFQHSREWNILPPEFYWGTFFL